MHPFIEHLRSSAFEDTAGIAEHEPDLTGWMCERFEHVFLDHLRRVHALRQRPLTIVEVGTWKGLSAITMATIAKRHNIPVTIVCVDTWLGAPEFWTWGLHDATRGQSLKRRNGYPAVYYTFLRNVLDSGHADAIVPFPISSTEAIQVFKHYDIRADLVYVDASHEYQAVKNDIEAVWDLVEPAGTVFGDDYMPGWPGVMQAVNEFSVQHPAHVDGVVWSIVKPGTTA